MLNRYFVFCALVLVFSSVCFAEDTPDNVKKTTQIVIGVNNWLPFLDKNKPKGGDIGELLEAAFAQRGISVKLKWLPWGRMKTAALAGDIDAAFPWVGSAKSDERFLYSPSVYRGSVLALTSVKKPLKIQGMKSLEGLTVAGLKDDYYNKEFNDFESTKKFTLFRLRRHEQILNMVANERVDVGLVARYRVEEVLSTFNMKDRLTVNYPPLFYREVRMMFAPKNHYLNSEFTKGFRALQASGVWPVSE